ncbi:MAG: helix-turn-helix domain-containing protein [Pseudonocardiaceae bacterium]
MTDDDPMVDLLNIDQAAEILDVSRATVQRMIAEGRLAALHHAGKRWVERAEIDDYFARQRAAAAQDRATRARHNSRTRKNNNDTEATESDRSTTRRVRRTRKKKDTEPDTSAAA